MGLIWVPMSESTEGSQISVVPVVSILENGTLRPAVAPPGTVFSLGWLMAELFDPRRRVSVWERQPPFNPDVQLPQVPDLTPEPQLVFLVAELTELGTWFKALAAKTAKVTAEAHKLQAAVDAADVTMGEEAAAADAADAAAAGGVIMAAAEAPFSEATFLAAVVELNQAILDDLADNAERLSAYQLGLALSDLTWLPRIAQPGQAISDASKPSALSGLFSRPQLATVKTLLNGAGTQLPASAAAIVSGSLDNWADWLDVHMTNITTTGADVWSPKAGVVLDALRVQGTIWRSVLIADPDVSLTPSMGAWVQAGSSIARAIRMLGAVILRRFWPVVVVLLATLGGLLYLVISNLSGISQVWASLVTVAAVLGVGGYGLGGGVSQSFSGVGYEIWAAAKLDALVWSITWLPALTATTMQRTQLDRLGVAAPQIRKNLDPQ
jgi:hypothetical protein